MAFFLQQQLLVAGDTFGKIGRNLVRSVERSHHDSVHVGQCGTHRLSLRAQHVHVAVEHRHVVSGSGRIDIHFTSTVAGLILTRVGAVFARTNRVVLLHDLGPHHACGAELRDFHEIDTADAEVEFDFLGGEGCRDTGLHHQVEVFVPPCQSVAQFLIDIGAGVAKRVGIDTNATHFGEGCENIDQFRQFVQQGGRILTFGQNLLHRVEVDATYQCGAVISFFIVVCRQETG